MGDLVCGEIADRLVGDFERPLAHGFGHRGQAALGLFHHAGEYAGDIAVGGVDLALLGKAIDDIAHRQKALLRGYIRALQPQPGFRDLGRYQPAGRDRVADFAGNVQRAGGC